MSPKWKFTTFFYVLSGKIKYSKDLRGGGNVFSEINLCEIYVVSFYIYL